MAVYGPENNEELYHYGVPGMKWGIRRYQNRDGSLTPRGKTRRNAKKMSDDELRKVINRMQLENQYNQLSKSRISKGRKFLKNVNAGAVKLAAATTTAITLYNNYEKLLAIGEIISKKKKG